MDQDPTVDRLVRGSIAGLGLGVAARAWMRVIAEHPAFSWSGTLGIVFGFAVFGVAQAGASIARGTQRPGVRPTRLSVFRFLGLVGMLPLFVAAGAPMLPTVIAGGLANARVDWRPRTRLVLAGIALVPVIIVSGQIVDTFGLSVRAVVGVIGLVALYATIVRIAASTFSPRPDGHRLSTWATAATVASVGILIAVPLAIGGIG